MLPQVASVVVSLTFLALPLQVRAIAISDPLMIAAHYYALENATTHCPTLKWINNVELAAS